MRAVGRDAEGDQRLGILLGGIQPGPDGLRERLTRADDVVRGEHGHRAVRIAAGQQVGGEADRVRGVAADRLPDQIRPRNVGQRIGDLIDVVGGGDDPGVFGFEQPLEPLAGQFDQRGPVKQPQQLLGPQPPAQGPQPRSRSPGHDDGVSHERPP